MNLNSIHNKPKNAKFLSYGTAGFRSHADHLSTFIMYRVGILAALRSYKCDSKTIGVMITASHNPPQDNGVKVVEPDGSMLTMSWEKLAIELCNCDNDDLQNQINQIIIEQKIDVESVSSATNGGAKVIIGYDTRETSERFADAVIDGVNSFETALSINFNVLTTPQLHYLVVADNTSNEAFLNLSEHGISPIPFGDGVVPYGKFSEKGYYEKLSTAFEKLLKNRNSNVDGVTVDCANGVGALKLAELNTYLARHFRQFNIENREVKTFSKLNSGCGADFVKVKQRIPETGNFSGKNKNFVSFDGDADRIVYFYNDDDGKFHLLDGDKIASLLAKQLNTWLSEAELEAYSQTI